MHSNFLWFNIYNPQITTSGAQSFNVLQWLDLKEWHQDISTANVH